MIVVFVGVLVVVWRRGRFVGIGELGVAVVGLCLLGFVGGYLVLGWVVGCGRVGVGEWLFVGV